MGMARAVWSLQCLPAPSPSAGCACCPAQLRSRLNPPPAPRKSSLTEPSSPRDRRDWGTFDFPTPPPSLYQPSETETPLRHFGRRGRSVCLVDFLTRAEMGSFQTKIAGLSFHWAARSHLPPCSPHPLPRPDPTLPRREQHESPGPAALDSTSTGAHTRLSRDCARPREEEHLPEQPAVRGAPPAPSASRTIWFKLPRASRLSASRSLHPKRGLKVWSWISIWLSSLIFASLSGAPRAPHLPLQTVSDRFSPFTFFQCVSNFLPGSAPNATLLRGGRATVKARGMEKAPASLVSSALKKNVVVPHSHPNIPPPPTQGLDRSWRGL